MSDYFLGEIRLMAITYAPQDWHMCDGSMLSVQTYQALFSLLGTAYGGDGRATFGIPDLRGRLPIGQGQGAGLTARVLGQWGGADQVSLTADQMPLHNHTLMTAGTTANTAIPGPQVTFANTTPPTVEYVQNGAPGATAVQLNINTIDYNVTSDAPHANVMPCMPLNFMICTNGLYPPRN